MDLNVAILNHAHHVTDGCVQGKKLNQKGKDGSTRSWAACSQAGAVKESMEQCNAVQRFYVWYIADGNKMV